MRRTAGRELLLRYGLEDSLVTSSDYTHSDQAAQLEAHRMIKQRAERGEASQTAVRKMLEDNPRQLYGL